MSASRKFLIGILLGGGVTAVVVSTASCGNDSKTDVAQDRVSVIRRGNVVVVGSKGPAQAIINNMQKTDKLWEHTNLGSALMKQGKYQEAIQEYKEAIKYAEYNYDFWVPRQHLVDAYEATGQYDSALLEVKELRKNALGEKVKIDLKNRELQILKKLSEVKSKAAQQNQQPT
jgi:tetratricopeptide (TPR) repeat protein